MIEVTILKDGKLKGASLFRGFIVKFTSAKLHLPKIDTREITVVEHTLLKFTFLQHVSGKRHLIEPAFFEYQLTQVLWPAVTGKGLCSE